MIRYHRYAPTFRYLATNQTLTLIHIYFRSHINFYQNMKCLQHRYRVLLRVCGATLTLTSQTLLLLCFTWDSLEMTNLLCHTLRWQQNAFSLQTMRAFMFKNQLEFEFDIFSL